MDVLSAGDGGGDISRETPDLPPAQPLESGLFPPAASRAVVGDRLSLALAAAETRICDGPVRAKTSHAENAEALRDFDFAAPRKIDEVLDWVISGMEHGAVHIAHPRYFGLFNPAPSFPAQCADRITAAFNPQLATATTSPFPVALEAHVIGQFASRAGLKPGSGGHFTTGGTEANATALICALTQAEPAFAGQGARAFRGQPVFYVSKDAHLAWLKIAHQAGIGRAAVRLVITDGQGRMDANAVEAAIDADRKAGCVPVMIAATAGTTNAGMIDPLAACADLARGSNAWFHVDAAWGGAILVSDRLRPLLAGLERADSITIDAHKWLATTMGCGMFLTSRPDVLSDAFQVTMDCMPSNTAGLDPYVTTMQWSRRFLGLRLFVGLAAAGWDGYAVHIERAIDLANQLAADLISHGWRRANRSDLAVLCMVPPASAPCAGTIAARVVSGGEAWVSATVFEGQDAVRICVTNGMSTESDIGRLAAALHACAVA
jgi:glutamate/tyrosine decarboxylase-like PLP-dependent enzyme